VACHALVSICYDYIISVFPKVGDITPIGAALELSRGAMEVTSLIGGHFITKWGQ